MYMYMYMCMYMYIYPNQNTPGVKKVESCNQDSKKGHAEKDVKSKWATKASLLLMELIFLIMMTRPQNITVPTNCKVVVAGNSNVL